MNKYVMVMMASVAVAGTAQAAKPMSMQNWYVGGRVNFVNVDVDGLGSTSPRAVAGVAGYSINSNLAVEGRLGLGQDDDDVAGVNVDVKSYLSVLARGTLPINQQINVYGVLGVTSGRIKLSNRFGSNSSTDMGLAYGVGGEVTFAKQHGVSLEWAHLWSGDVGTASYDVEGVSVGYRYRF